MGFQVQIYEIKKFIKSLCVKNCFNSKIIAIFISINMYDTYRTELMYENFKNTIILKDLTIIILIFCKLVFGKENYLNFDQNEKLTNTFV